VQENKSARCAGTQLACVLTSMTAWVCSKSAGYTVMLLHHYDSQTAECIMEISGDNIKGLCCCTPAMCASSNACPAVHQLLGGIKTIRGQ
jgi:hypothetical protein